jgi:hypothetical protein
MEQPKKVYAKYKGGRYCCVVGCSTLQGRDDFRFLSFPLVRNPTQALLWKQAINRVEADGSKWIPRPTHIICGKHFISGEPSNIQNNPDYVPSIFPTKQRRKKREIEMMNRYQRVKF